MNAKQRLPRRWLRVKRLFLHRIGFCRTRNRSMRADRHRGKGCSRSLGDYQAIVSGLNPGLDLGESSVGVSQKSNGRNGRFIDTLFHLQFARSAFGASDLCRGLLHGADESPTDAKAVSVVLSFESVDTGHARAARVGLQDAQARDQLK